MEVELIAMTCGVHGETTEDIDAKAMLGCQSTKAAFEIHPSREKVQEMIRMAIESGHVSVLEHSVFTFSVKGVSRACTHQLVRHRIASYSQQSQRHVNPTKNPEWFVTPPTIQDLEANTEVGSNVFKNPQNIFENMMKRAAEGYDILLRMGISEEDARFVLPNACKTNIVITMNVRELRHFFKLRRAKDAQWEIRAMADEMYKELHRRFPILFD